MPAVSDVTDATFEHDVLDRSVDLPVVVDLWAPWCNPCRTLGPILEKVVEATNGAVELVKVNVDDNPRVYSAFQVQSIPAVFAVRDRQIVDHFIGAIPERQVSEFIARLAPAPSEADDLVAAGDEASLRRALELEPDHRTGVVALARVLVAGGSPAEALELLARIPETPDSRVVAAEARLAAQRVEVPADGVEVLLDALLPKVKDDTEARQEFLDLLETLGAEDPRTARYRKALSAQLF
ncbi:MAG TPA: tetratricopeptide repeat protein [Acidimicrobiales bacterium]|nr:tetratricopeptide repeat protein [Acidimicrobiales bacterium]